jgi:hypothetical protein
VGYTITLVLEGHIAQSGLQALLRRFSYTLRWPCAPAYCSDDLAIVSMLQL